ncbi:nucleolin-like isoform X2 [Mastacembelus armatus]|uniref:nucleolin-like isoform X2 n=1 Tax=Mastacembelus armatus TaxID=205130 RepID=UPI000E459B0D|nr:nucleolin-like isoform X2 [Mastacembelus armatus]
MWMFLAQHTCNVTLLLQTVVSDCVLCFLKMEKATRRRKRQSKVVSKDVEEDNNLNAEGQTKTEQTAGTEEDSPTEHSKMKQEGKEAETQAISSADAVDSMEQEKEGITGDQVNGKQRARCNVETSPSKKPKLIDEGFCVFVGNLNNSKPFEEVRDSLARYFMTQSLLVQDIRVARSKKHAHVDLASEMDMTKALKLTGEMVLDKPIKIAKAMVKSEDKVKVKAAPVDKKNARCLFLKNVPYDATKQDILKIFHKAIAVRFPGGTKTPIKGIAFVEFNNTAIAKKVRQKRQGAKIQGRVLIVDSVGETHSTEVTKTNDDESITKAPAPPSNILFVSNLSFTVKEINLKRVFQKAVKVTIPQYKGKSRGYAFVKFATVADAEKALKSSQNIKICKRAVTVQFCEVRAKPEKEKVLSKTLIVTNLAEKTTAETLKSAFEGALSARVTVDKDTGLSKRFGFVEFETEENATAAKAGLEDCEIDGSKVTVAYAKPRGERGRQGARGGLVGRPGGPPAGLGSGKGRSRVRGSRGERGRGAGVSQDTVKGGENKC